MVRRLGALRGVGGTVGSLPEPDARVSTASTWANYSYVAESTDEVCTSTCCLASSDYNAGDFSVERTVTADGSVARVGYDMDSCIERWSFVDDRAFGYWGDEWEDDPTDADDDGFTDDGGLDTCECDDADPDVNRSRGRTCDDMDGDGYDVPGDCDDAQSNVHPSASDPPGDAVDQDCDGHDDTDADRDGYTADGDDEPADCDETSDAVNPDAEEVPYNGEDEDCSGSDLTDVDGDGHDAEVVGGDDCYDRSRKINPDATDIPGDGVDQDCDGTDAVSEAEDTGETAPEPPAPVREEEEPGCAHVSAPPGAWLPVWSLLLWGALRGAEPPVPRRSR